MHALITGNTIVKYPYGINELRRENPNVSFPIVPSDDLLAEFNVQRVFFSAPAIVSHHEKCAELLPVFNEVDNRWVQSWAVSNLTAEELEQKDLAISTEVRSQRNALLAGCDWVVLKATEEGSSVSSQWIAYRQGLRDISGQVGFPNDIVWPVAP